MLLSVARAFGAAKNFHFKRILFTSSPRVVRKSFGTIMEKYTGWSNEQLINRIAELERLGEHNQIGQQRSQSQAPTQDPKAIGEQSTQINAGLPQPDEKVSKLSGKRQIKKCREFNIDLYPKRKIALKISYDGAAYYGFAKQGNSAPEEIENQYPTVEGEIFKALLKSRLISAEDKCGYSRCGRTDRGVSAFGQVVALYVRSTAKWLDSQPSSEALPSKEDCYINEINNNRPVILPSNEDEMPFVRMLNRMLPEDIRVLAWCPVRSDFDARFSCKSRQYRYLFPKTDLDIQAMQEAAQKYVGTHDFRNFCRVDLAKNIQSFERTILEAEIEPVNIGSQNYPSAKIEEAQLPRTRFESGLTTNNHGLTEWYQFRIKGTAFLWHQVRCLVAFLFLVGQQLEKPDIIEKMLDVKTMSGKPEYRMGSDLPLILDDCEFDESETKWIYHQSQTDLTMLWVLHRQLVGQWTRSCIKAGFSFILLNKVLNLPVTVVDAEDGTSSFEKNSGKLKKKAKAISNSLQCVNEKENQELSDELITLPWSECVKRRLYVQNNNTCIYVGGNEYALSKKYVPVVDRNRSEDVNVRNERYQKRIRGE